MSGGVRVVVTIGVFVAMMALVIVRPRRWNEAWWTSLAAAVFLGLGIVAPRDALAAALDGKSALLFLLALLMLSLLVGKSGFFEWAALQCARLARGDARALFRNTFVLGAIITATLSLDTTAVILTPVVIAMVKRAKVPATPYLVLCAYVANVGSLVLPISNLTNILFADAFGLTFAEFGARMIAPQLAVLIALYFFLRREFRGQLPLRVDAENAPAPDAVIVNRPYFFACSSVLGVALVGYFLAPLAHVEPYAVAFVCSAMLAVVGLATRAIRPSVAREISWSLFPFVIGLFIAVRAVETLGIIDTTSAALARIPNRSPLMLLGAASMTAIASNLANNLPAALLMRSILLSGHAGSGAVYAALVGADVGPLVTPFASLATMLVVAIARREGQPLGFRRLIMLGLRVTPILVLVGIAALWLVTAVAP